MTFGTPILRLLRAREGCREERQSEDERCTSQNFSRYHHEHVTPPQYRIRSTSPPSGALEI